tara:strand:+ start:758 stop:1138 length:381 start_codon:yes stop_codon:yes gene_type:complete
MKKLLYVLAPLAMVLTSCGYSSIFEAKSNCLKWANESDTYTGFIKAIERNESNQNLPQEFFSDTKAVFSRRRCQQEIETKQILGLVTSNREAKKEYEFNASQRDNENPLRIIDNNIIWNVEKNFRY